MFLTLSLIIIMTGHCDKHQHNATIPKSYDAKLVLFRFWVDLGPVHTGVSILSSFKYHPVTVLLVFCTAIGQYRGWLKATQNLILIPVSPRFSLNTQVIMLVSASYHSAIATGKSKLLNVGYKGKRVCMGTTLYPTDQPLWIQTHSY